MAEKDLDVEQLRAAIEAVAGPATARTRVAVASGWQGGKRLYRRLSHGTHGPTVLTRLLERLLESVHKREAPPEVIVLDLGGEFRPVAAAAFENRGRAQVGRKGIALLRGKRWAGGVMPSEMLAANHDFQTAFRALLAEKTEAGLTPALFDASHFALRLGPPPSVRPLYRGNTVVRPRDVNRASIDELANGMIAWMRSNVDAHGAITYLLHPHRRQAPPRNNSIRQCMATVCLNRIALLTRDPADRDRADRNLAHLLAQDFRRDGDLGFIAEGPKAKLGAAALAALAIVENPSATAHADAFAALSRTVDRLWQPDGSFRTFLHPSDRNDNQNFYPGEALLFWATLLRAGRGDSARFMKSAEHYIRHFRASSNPAFVPWHTQAYVMALPVLRANDAASLRAFVFEMNDWLLSMQQWEDAPFPDLKGRFYDPKHPDYGPPHASSTGVYLEGLADAYWLARLTGDDDRAARYRLSILRGLRSLQQLQFRADDEMFYVPNRAAVFGGIRVEAYDSTIRVDNIQHGLMATMKVLSTFSAPDLSLV